MNNDFVRKGYNKIADEYLRQRKIFENNTYIDKLLEVLPKGSTILDLGCGGGVPIDTYLIEKGHNILGIDISEKQIEIAKKNVPQAIYTVEDMSELSYGEYHVDAIVSFYAIFHTPRNTHRELFKKLHSFLKSNGYILVTMGSSEWEGKDENFHGTEMWWSHYDSNKNRELIESSGFKILVDEIDGTGDEKHQVILAKK